MKKKLAFILAAAMALTSLPGVAFAKSDNSVSNVTSVKADTDLTRAWITSGDIPWLEILTHADVKVTMGSKVRLTLKNSEWLLDDNDKLVLQDSDIKIDTPNTQSTDTKLDVVNVTYLSKTQIELTLGTAVTDAVATVPAETFTANTSTQVGSAGTDAIAFTDAGGFKK